MDRQDHNDTGVFDGSVPQPPEESTRDDVTLRFEGYEAIEALQETSQEAGWDIEYRQIEPGRVHAATRSKLIGDTIILHEWADRFLQVRAATPADAITVMVGVPRVNLGVNGHHFSDDCILILPPGTEMLCSAPPPGEALQAHFPVDQFISSLNAMAPGWNARSLRDAQLIEVGQHAASIRNALLESLDESQVHCGAQVSSNLVALVIKAIGQSAARFVNEDRYHWRQRYRALRRVSNYIDEHLQQPITIPELCEVAGVSLSTLERLFRRELGLTPKQYLQSRRLNRARRYIHEPSSEKTIAEIATRCGFTHFGRFSVAYRQQFGVLPSQDLRSD